MTSIVDFDRGQGSQRVRDRILPRLLEWRLGVQVVAIDPSAAFRKALRMWLPRTAVAVDHGAAHFAMVAGVGGPI